MSPHTVVGAGAEKFDPGAGVVSLSVHYISWPKLFLRELRVTTDLRITSAKLMPDVRGAFPNIERRTMTAGRYESATAETTCHFQALPIDPLFCTSDNEGRSQTDPEMKSLILKRSVVLRGHKTSISVEDAFWSSVKEIAASGQMTVSELISAIDSERHHGNLSSSIRLFVLNFYREQLLERLDIRDKRKAIQRLISGIGGMPS